MQLDFTHNRVYNKGAKIYFVSFRAKFSSGDKIYFVVFVTSSTDNKIPQYGYISLLLK